ncbi:class 1 integron integrase protein IntI1 [Escherichia coli]|nr:class 1 integron integrase protein IntI1 [Escherichia coli]
MKTATAPLPPLRSVKVLDQLRERIRYLHYSLRTEQAYVHWVRAFIRFHGVRHPATLGSSEVEAFLSWLANERKVSVSTHRQALAALLFFYGKVLCTDLPWLQEIGRPRPSRRLPVVLTPDEVVRILGFLEGEHRLFAQLLYGTGMRISGTVAKLAMRQPFVLFKGLTFQKLCLPGAFRPGDHHNKMLRPGLCVVHASPQYL